jgi:predicted dehydrogenase
VDLIVVTTPSSDHYTFVRDAMIAGKHVVVEKPFTVTSYDANELVDLAKEKGRVLSVYHNRRWDGDFLTIQQIVKDGLLGKIVEAEFHWDRYIPIVNTSRWRESNSPGSGILYDLGSHFIDQALVLFGKPDPIHADSRIQREGGLADDYIDVTMGYGNGLKVILKSSKLVRQNGPRYILHGTKGSFTKYGLDPQEGDLIKGLAPIGPQWGKEPQEMWGRLDTTVGELHVTGTIETIPGSYTHYYQNIADHINGSADLIVKPEEAGLAIRMIELALQSSKEEKTVRVNM